MAFLCVGGWTLYMPLQGTLAPKDEKAMAIPERLLDLFTAVLSTLTHGWAHTACHELKQLVQHRSSHRLHSTVCFGYLDSLHQIGHAEPRW